VRDWSDEMIQKTKDHFREHYGAEFSTEDAIESLNNIVNLFELLMEWDLQDRMKMSNAKAENENSDPI